MFVRDNLDPPAKPSLPQPFLVQGQDLQHLFGKRNLRKAPGPDGIYLATLRYCAEHLSPVFKVFFFSTCHCESTTYHYASQSPKGQD